MGELRGPEAFKFLPAAIASHPESVATIHADSLSGALEPSAMLKPRLQATITNIFTSNATAIDMLA